MASININKQTNKKQGDKKPKGGLGMKKTVLGIMVTIITLALTACPSPPPPAPAGDFSLAANAVTITKGNSGTVTVTVNRTNGFSDLVDLVLSGEPTGVTGSFNPTSADASSDLTINVTNAATPGSYTLTVTGTADGKTRTAVFSLNVTALADTTKPKILSVSPSNNKSGVVNNTNIVIKFSEPMNKASGQAAYQSSTSGIKPSEVSFNWNAAGTTLTINPNSNLKYRAITNLLTPAFTYIYNITNTATDLAGNSLANPQTVKFKTLRSMTHTLFSVIDADIRSDGKVGACGIVSQTLGFACIGDSGAVGNADYKAFFGFNIVSLPNNINKIVSAKFSAYQRNVTGDPYGSIMQKIIIEHVDFGTTIKFNDFNTNTLHTAAVFSTNVTPGYKTEDVTISLKDDYAKRASRGNRSQYRLRFSVPTDGDGNTDVAYFHTKEQTGTSKDPKLVIIYLVP